MKVFKSALFLIVSISLVAFFIVDSFIGPPSHAEMERLRTQGNEIIRLLEKHKELNNEYPENLGFINGDMIQKKYGGWVYKYESTNRTFELSIGKYENDLFVLYWVQKERKWYVDR